MNLRWVPRQKHRISTKHITHGIYPEFLVVLQAAVHPQSQPAKYYSHLVVTLVDRFVNQQLLWGSRNETYIWSCISFWFNCLCVFFRPDGPITKNVEDNAYLLEAISGLDANDSTSINQPVERFSDSLTGDIKGLRIGVPKEYLAEGVDPGVKQAVLDALKTLEKLGATWDEVSLPHSEYGVASYYILASSEASSNLSRFDGVRYGYRSPNATTLEELYTKTRSEGFGDEVKRRIMLGTYALSSGYYDAYYKKHNKHVR